MNTHPQDRKMGSMRGPDEGLVTVSFVLYAFFSLSRLSLREEKKYEFV